MFKNLKIGVRLGVAFATTLVLMVAIALISIGRLGDINSEVDTLANRRFSNTLFASDMLHGANAAARAYRNALLLPKEDDIRKELETALKGRQRIADGLDKLERNLDTEKGRDLFKAIAATRAPYASIQEKLVETIKAGKRDEAITMLIAEVRPRQTAFMSAVEEMIAFQKNGVQQSAELAAEIYQSGRTLILVISAAALLLACAIGLWITLSITRPLNNVVDAAKKMAVGDFDFKLESDGRDEVAEVVRAVVTVQHAIQAMVADAALLSAATIEGKLATRADAGKHLGDFRKIISGVNQSLDAVVEPLNIAADYVERIAKGEIPEKITETYHGDFNTIKNNLNVLIETLGMLIKGVGRMADNMKEGKLKDRGNAELFQADWKTLVVEINSIADNLVQPLNVAADAVANIAKGDIPPKITEAYQGDFNVLKNNLNTCIDAVNALVADANLLSGAAVAGQLETRADATKHQGDFRKVIDGVNDTLDAVVRPVQDVQRVMAAMEQGDMTQGITKPYQGDFATLKDAINHTIAKLVDTITQINTAADALTNAASQVSSTAQSLSQSSSEQAASVEETTSSMEQMTASISQNTENAKVTDGMAAKSAKEAAEGGDAVNKTVDDMKSIAGKIGIIDDIAYQTNLLALNAAIEAARAGDHGKGFAVVAAEVRKLAERSQVAAQEIGNLATSSVKQAERAGTLLTEMVPSIRKTSDLVQEIASASQEQSAGVAQINGAMGQLNQTTQQNASASEELAATAEELGAQANELQQTMTFFKLDEGNHGARQAAKTPPRRNQAFAVARVASVPVSDGDFERF